MLIVDVEVYNEKKDTEKVKEFRVEYYDDCNSVVVELGNDSFVIDYGVWKAINRFVIDRHDGDLVEYNGEDCEDCVNG